MPFARDEVLVALPYARRFARALARRQDAGDALVTAALRDMTSQAGDARLALYAAVVEAARRDVEGSMPQKTLPGRCMLILTALEELSLDEAAEVLALTPDVAAAELAGAKAALQTESAADILIIEDEPIIAMDIEALVRRAGHRVVGIAASEAEAVLLANSTRPTLILADIKLGLGGDGSRAVARILEAMTVPVIFVTAYPERLLTGEGFEPTYVITKPFDPVALAVMTYQAAMGGAREV